MNTFFTHFIFFRGCFAFGICLTLITFLSINSYGQNGYLEDDFSTGNTYNWGAVTAGSSASFISGRYTVKMALQSNGKYRADLRKNGGATFHAGNYPVIAIKFNKPPRSNFFFDTNLGSYNNGNNNATKIPAENSNVYYWDLSTGRLGTTILSKTQPTTLSLFQFKIADIVLTQEEIAANDINYEVDWVRSFPSVDSLRAFVAPDGNPSQQFQFTGQFAHPGLLHSAGDLVRIRSQVAEKFGRAYKSYELLLMSNKSSFSYSKAGPFRLLTRDPSITVDGVNGGTVKNGVESDFMAAYYNALMWNITSNEAHAEKAIEIINAYSSFTTGIVGADAELNGLYGFMLANAAELMSSTYPAWAQSDVLKCQAMLKSVFYPVIGNFRPCGHGNWDIICMKALMAIAIFTEDKPMFNKAVNYFYNGEGNGSIDNYVLTEAGQLQESNRDQPHTMLAIGSLAEISEMALKHGVDLYSASNNAILRGYEYTSRYNLGYDVPYQTSYDFCEKNYQDYTPEAISSVGRGLFRAVFEIAYNHYVFRKGLQMPNTLEVLSKLGPEGAPFGADNPGYGSLFFYLNPEPDYEQVGGNPVDSAAGLIDDNFVTGTDGWKAATSGSAATVENGELKVSIVMQSNGKGRGDMQKNGTALYPGQYPILAIKMKKPQAVNFTFDTNLGAYGNGANKWTGKVGEEIYYYDLTKNFGADKYLPSTIPTVLSTFQFKVADITSGENSYTVDWIKTVKTVEELQAFNPLTGLIDDNFTSGADSWSINTSGATLTNENGQLRVALAAQANGSKRADIKRNTGATLFPQNYPIVAIKLQKPLLANITFDTNLGSFGNGSNKWTGKVGEDIFYFDLSKTGFGTASTKLSTPTLLSLFQFKVADIRSGESTYQVDWVKSVKTVEELNAFISPAYQTITFPVIAEKKVDDQDFSPATSSSNLPVSYTSSNPNVAAILNGKVHITGAGSSIITANQQGSQAYYPAEIVSQNLVVSKKEQTITFDIPEPRLVSDKGFVLVGRSSSGLQVSFKSSDSTVAVVQGDSVRISRAGISLITASQPGDGIYSAAQDVSRTLTVLKPYYADADGDGFGSKTAKLFATEQTPVGYSENDRDCDDTRVLYTDNDGDGLGTGEPAACGVIDNTDCDDTNPVTMSAQIPPVHALSMGTRANTLYVGYGPSYLNITAVATGGTSPYTYHWNTGELTETISASPGTYQVLITDVKGCRASATIVISSQSVVCGNKADKVLICHKGKEICISSNAVQEHLAHGDSLGVCSSISPLTVADKGSMSNEFSGLLTTPEISIYPNPVTTELKIQLDQLQEGAHLQMFNTLGTKVISRRIENNPQTITVQGMPAGVYYLKIANGAEISIKKIIKE